MDTPHIYPEHFLVFFFGIFWGRVLAVAAKFRPFHTASGEEEARNRFWVSLIVLNVAPLLLLWGLFFVATNCIPDGWSYWAILFAATSALSLFSIPRFLHALVATRWRKCFYSDREWTFEVSQELHVHGESLPPSRASLDVKNPPLAQDFGRHFWPGFWYLVCSLGIAGLAPFSAWLSCSK